MSKVRVPIGEKIFNAINYIFLTLLAMTTLFPFLNVFAVSFSSNYAVNLGIVSVFPIEFQTLAYEIIIRQGTIFTAMKNTIFITVVGTIVNMLMTMLAAYPLSKKRLKLRTPLILFITFTMWFSGGMIPNFLVVKSLGLFNSLWALIIPSAIAVYNMIILKTFFEQMPAEIEESAQIDGCNDMMILFRIVMPLSLPVIATLSLFYAVGHWNTFMAAIMYINTPAKYPLQVKLREVLMLNNMADMLTNSERYNEDQQLVPETIKAASIIISTIPIIIVYPFMQKHFVKGVMIGSIKG